MKYCMNCGAEVKPQVPKGDDRPRYVCENCTAIHYQNPNMVVGTIPVKDDKILLCRRAIEPCREKWTLPAGYLENGETVSACAVRETMEEAWAKVEDLHPYALMNLPFINQVYFMLRARLINHDFHAGSESLEVRLFYPDEIPWEELAFHSIHEVLRNYCEDIKTKEFPFRILDIAPHSIQHEGASLSKL